MSCGILHVGSNLHMDHERIECLCSHSVYYIRLASVEWNIYTEYRKESKQLFVKHQVSMKTCQVVESNEDNIGFAI